MFFLLNSKVLVRRTVCYRFLYLYFLFSSVVFCREIGGAKNISRVAAKHVVVKLLQNIKIEKPRVCLH